MLLLFLILQKCFFLGTYDEEASGLNEIRHSRRYQGNDVIAHDEIHPNLLWPGADDEHKEHHSEYLNEIGDKYVQQPRMLIGNFRKN